MVDSIPSFMPYENNDSGQNEPPEQDLASAPNPMDRQTFNQLVETLYTKLKPLAARVRWVQGNSSLSATVLLHDAYLKLLQTKQFTAGSENAVIGMFANVMKQIIVDAARRKKAQKHGGGAIFPLKDGDSQVLGLRADKEALPYEDLLALSVAQAELRAVNPRQAEIIDRRFYLGLTVGETAQLLGYSITTIEREYHQAKHFLRSRLRPPQSHPGTPHA